MQVWQQHEIGPVATNCYVVGEDTADAIMFDPGGPEAVQIARNLQAEGTAIKHIIVTHAHFDHLGWATEVQKVTNAKVYLHDGAKTAYKHFQTWLAKIGFADVELGVPDVWLQDNQQLSASGLTFNILHTPGHSPGSAVFVLQKRQQAFVGDLIFKQSIGRTDLPFSDQELMAQSLKRVMTELPDGTTLYPGHGDPTTMGTEKLHNPYLIGIQRGISPF